MNSNFRYVKLLLVILTWFLGINNVYSLDFSYYVDGYWSDWGATGGYHMQGSMKNMVLYYDDDHPSIFVLRFKTDNYTTPTKKEIKNHNKNKTWFTYSGTVEYWVSEEYPTIKDALKKHHYLVTNPESKIGNYNNSGRKVKRTANAKIQCQLYEDGVPKVINLFFDEVGYAISIRSWDY